MLNCHREWLNFFDMLHRLWMLIWWSSKWNHLSLCHLHFRHSYLSTLTAWFLQQTALLTKLLEQLTTCYLFHSSTLHAVVVTEPATVTRPATTMEPTTITNCCYSNDDPSHWKLPICSTTCSYSHATLVPKLMTHTFGGTITQPPGYQIKTQPRYRTLSNTTPPVPAQIYQKMERSALGS